MALQRGARQAGHIMFMEPPENALLSKVGDDVLVHLYLKSDGENDHILLENHEIVLQVTKKHCGDPELWSRVKGEALVDIKMTAIDGTNNLMWQGQFSLPIPGTYHLDIRWFGCENVKHDPILNSPLSFEAHGPPKSLPGRNGELFNGASWLSRDAPQITGSPIPFVWKDPNSPITGESLIDVPGTYLIREATANPPGSFFSFRDTGNYELVCFMGNKTMSSIREHFLTIRSKIFAGQRPFKFHFYSISSFVKPDKNWDNFTKSRFRKCKHVLFHLDELDTSVSQKQYIEQYTTFVGHLVKLLNNPTFPIWLFTNHGRASTTKNCGDPHLPRTTDHPCNDALHYIIENAQFSGQVHLLDNTDLSLPLFGEQEEDLFFLVALRVFVIVGNGVSYWRSIGQAGKIDGLHINDTVIPNFELIPYEGW